MTAILQMTNSNALRLMLSVTAILAAMSLQPSTASAAVKCAPIGSVNASTTGFFGARPTAYEDACIDTSGAVNGGSTQAGGLSFHWVRHSISIRPVSAPAVYGYDPYVNVRSCSFSGIPSSYTIPAAANFYWPNVNAQYCSGAFSLPHNGTAYYLNSALCFDAKDDGLGTRCATSRTTFTSCRRRVSQDGSGSGTSYQAALVSRRGAVRRGALRRGDHRVAD